MSKLKGEYSGNSLLDSLTSAELEVLSKHFEWVDLEIHDVLHSSSKPSPFIYFPISGVYSVLPHETDGKTLEVGLVGSEGLVGLSLCLFVSEPSFEVVVQAAGRAVRISERNFMRVYNSSLAVRKMVLRYAYAFLVQVSQTAIANAQMTIEQRLARWLLMYQDRMDGPVLGLTHQILSNILGVRRSGITVALQSLESAKAIKATRGNVRVLDRTKLKHIAGSVYGAAEREYQKIMLRKEKR